MFSTEIINQGFPGDITKKMKDTAIGRHVLPSMFFISAISSEEGSASHRWGVRIVGFSKTFIRHSWQPLLGSIDYRRVLLISQNTRYLCPHTCIASASLRRHPAAACMQQIIGRSFRLRHFRMRYRLLQRHRFNQTQLKSETSRLQLPWIDLWAVFVFVCSE